MNHPLCPAAQAIVAAAQAALLARADCLPVAAAFHPGDTAGKEPVLAFGGVVVVGAAASVGGTACSNRPLSLIEWGLWFDALLAALDDRERPLQPCRTIGGAPMGDDDNRFRQGLAEPPLPPEQALFAAFSREFLDGYERWESESAWSQAGWREVAGAFLRTCEAEAFVNELIRRGHLVAVYLS